jgi:hypothetical protein
MTRMRPVIGPDPEARVRAFRHQLADWVKERPGVLPSEPELGGGL